MGRVPWARETSDIGHPNRMTEPSSDLPPAGRSVPLTRRRFLALAGLALAAAPLTAAPVLADEAWVQNFQDARLWSAPKGGKSVERAPQWSFFRVLGPQEEQRIPVEHPLTRQKVWIDAVLVGPSGPPPTTWAYQPVGSEQPSGGQPAASPSAAQAARPTATPQAGPASTTAAASGWLAPFKPTRLWSAPNAGVLLGTADPGVFFQKLEPQQGDRIKVKDPLTNGVLYAEASGLGPVGGPSGRIWVPSRWWGFVGADGINVRSDPSSGGAVVGNLERGTPVAVEAWVSGEEVVSDQPTWAKLGEGSYVYSPLLRKASIDLPPPMPQHGPLADQWLDVNLTQQTLTAYEGEQPIYMTYFSSGRPEWETHEGIFRIIYRVENETMESNRLLAADAARSAYRVENVRWTQYFSSDGQAIHENYWRQPELFGIPSSHGCLGMAAQDALWFWLWARTGLPLSSHF
jgi:hypothetical protein